MIKKNPIVVKYVNDSVIHNIDTLGKLGWV